MYAAAAVSLSASWPLPMAVQVASLTGSRTAPGAPVSQFLAPRTVAPRSVASRGQVLHIRAFLPLAVSLALPSTSTSRGGGARCLAAMTTDVSANRRRPWLF